jgi:hypothetical protein
MIYKVGIALGAVLLAAPTWAAGFGVTAGPQIEERMGSEFGAEYYYRQSNEARPRLRCQTTRVKTPTGHHRVRRCR